MEENNKNITEKEFEKILQLANVDSNQVLNFKGNKYVFPLISPPINDKDWGLSEMFSDLIKGGFQQGDGGVGKIFRQANQIGDSREGDKAFSSNMPKNFVSFTFLMLKLVGLFLLKIYLNYFFLFLLFQTLAVVYEVITGHDLKTSVLSITNFWSISSEHLGLLFLTLFLNALAGFLQFTQILIIGFFFLNLLTQILSVSSPFDSFLLSLAFMMAFLNTKTVISILINSSIIRTLMIPSSLFLIFYTIFFSASNEDCLVVHNEFKNFFSVNSQNSYSLKIPLLDFNIIYLILVSLGYLFTNGYLKNIPKPLIWFSFLKIKFEGYRVPKGESFNLFGFDELKNTQKGTLMLDVYDSPKEGDQYSKAISYWIILIFIMTSLLSIFNLQKNQSLVLNKNQKGISCFRSI